MAVLKFNVLSLSRCRMHVQGASVVTSESLVDNGFFLHVCILMACNIEWSMQVNWCYCTWLCILLSSRECYFNLI